MFLQPVSQLVLSDQRQKIDEALAIDKWTIIFWPASQCSSHREISAIILTDSHVFLELHALCIKLFSCNLLASQPTTASKNS